MDDDDEYLYGESIREDEATTSEPRPISYEKIQGSNGLITHLEEQAEATSANATTKNGSTPDMNGENYGEEEEAGSDDDSDDDVEIITEPVPRSLDFRGQNRPQTGRTAPPALSSNLPTAPRAAGLSLTTEYTPISRGGQPQPPLTPTDKSHLAQQDSSSISVGLNAHSQSASREPDDGIDTSTLPPATAPPSAPSMDLNAVGVFDGRSILEVDLSAMAEKPWRRPGSDISDWFNYGFDELSWETYCIRRRDLGELANVLKTNIINFSALQEDQLLALPPDVRTMVMTGASAMMNNAANPGMMAPGVMMDIGMLGAMGPMGMNGDMAAAMGGQMMQGIIPTDASTQGGQQGGPGVTAVTQEVGMMQDNTFNPTNTATGPGMMNIGMGGDYVIQEQNPMVQQMYPVMDAQNVQPSIPSNRGAPVPFRGRGMAPGRGGRGFAPRGRGRGGIYGNETPAVAPVRPASPLPPNVPTGPRNQNKYKDRDGNAPAVDGLDYGGGKDLMGRRTPSGEPEERISSRKRRSSPGLDDIRGSKRR